MALGATESPYLNGEAAPNFGLADYNDFYEVLFRLRDQILSGKHERIHIPHEVLVKNKQFLPLSKPSLNNETTADINQGHLNTVEAAHNKNVPLGVSNSHTLPNKPTSSGIDPALLTKSDNLLRAEWQIKRRRIERSLKDEYDALKSQSARDKDPGIDADLQLNMSDILAKAFEIIKPVSGEVDVPTDGNGRSESIDENSYYSSQVNSSSSEDGDLTGKTTDMIDESIPTQKAQAMPSDNGLHLQGDVSEVMELDDDYEPTADLHVAEQDTDAVNAVDFAEEVESDYSPPPPDANNHLRRDDRVSHATAGSVSRRKHNL
jgi:hypothetical protein